MIRKLLTKQAPKPVLDSTQLQALVTDLTEVKEGVIVGGQMHEESQFVGTIRTTFTF